MASFTGLKNVGEDVLEYMMKHRPWPDEELSAGLHDLDNVFPGIYGRHASDYKTFADDPRIDAQSLKVINSVRGNPEAMVDIYRAVPKGVRDFNTGDWVSISKNYAKQHGESALNGDYDLIKAKARAADISEPGDSIAEQGYWGSPVVGKITRGILPFFAAGSAAAAMSPEEAEASPLSKYTNLLGKFVDSLDYNDLPKNWADNPEIVQAAGELYRDMGTESPFFKAWENRLGKAEKAYHGGDGKIDDFSLRDPQRGYLGQAYFNTDPDVARKYALLGGIDESLDGVPDYVEMYNLYKDGTRKPHITSAYIAQKNPNKAQIDFRDFVENIPEKNLLDVFGPEIADDYDLSKKGLLKYFDDYLSNAPADAWEGSVGNDFLSLWGEANEGFLSALNSGLLPEYLKRKGSNAVRYADQEAGGVTIVPQSGNQIKSTSNRGTFNPDDTNIYRVLPFAAGGAGAAAALDPGEASASVPADQYRFPADEPGYVNREPGLGTPLVDVADLATAPIGAATAAGRAAAVAAEPFIAYGMDKAGNWLGNKVNGLLGYFGWGD